MIYYVHATTFNVRFHGPDNDGNNNIVCEKGSGSITSVAGALSEMNIEYSGEILHMNPYKFDISFTIATTLRGGSYMVLTFTNLHLPENDEFFCTINIDSYDIDGIGCVASYVNDEETDTYMRKVTISNLAEKTNSPGDVAIVLSLIAIDDNYPEISYSVTTYSENDGVVDSGSKLETIVISSNSHYVFFNVDNTYESSIARTSEYAPIRFKVTPA